MPKRTVSLVTLMAVLATLGLLACAAPVAPTPAVTPAPTPTPVWTSPHTPPPVTPPPGVSPITSTKFYPLLPYEYAWETIDLKTGDIVVLRITPFDPIGVSAGVDYPERRDAYILPQAITPDGVERTITFQAREDGKYHVFVRDVHESPGQGGARLTIEIYRR